MELFVKLSSTGFRTFFKRSNKPLFSGLLIIDRKISNGMKTIQVSGRHNDIEVHEIRLVNVNGVEILFSQYGATVVSILAPDSNGVLEEITLCYEKLSDLTSSSNPYYGCIVGRVANRIKNGAFHLNGRPYQLAKNNGNNHLHGGITGFNKKVWNYDTISGRKWTGVEFSYTSVDGEESYPGTVEIRVKYYLTDTNDIIISFRASSNETTIINLTNHIYWNLSGNLSHNITNHALTLNCNHYLPIIDMIPTGEVRDVTNTPFDFRGSVVLGDRIPLIDGGGIPGIDHCFVINTNNNDHPTSELVNELNDDDEVSRILNCSRLHHVAELMDPTSGRKLVMSATQPGVQIYTGNFLSSEASDAPHIRYNAVCLETEQFPDAINHPHFPSIVLNPGEIYEHYVIYSLRTT